MAQPERYPCPCGAPVLQYLIAIGEYVCPKCHKHFDVLSTEKSHVLYDGGPPKEITD